MEKWTFENDDGSNPAMRFARSYVKDWEQVRKESIGLLLWEGVLYLPCEDAPLCFFCGDSNITQRELPSLFFIIQL